MRYLIILILIPFIQLGISFLGQEFLPAPNSFLTKHLIYFLQQFFAVFVPTYFLFKKKSYLNQEECNVKGISNILQFAMLGICMQFLGIFINLPFSVMLQKTGFTPSPSIPPANSIIQLVIQTLTVCLTPAIFEEVLFRRMIFSSIKKHSGIAAIFLSALFFSMAHFDFFNLPATFFIGICLGIARYRGASLILCIMAHFCVNFSASALNILFENPAINDFFWRYFLLFIILVFTVFVSLFPKKQESEELTESALIRFGTYLLKILKNPLFYGYIILFVILGVRNL